VKHLNADAEDHQQGIALAGTPSPKRNIKRRKLNTKQKEPKSNVTRAVKTFYRSCNQIEALRMENINQFLITNVIFFASVGRVLIAFVLVISGSNKMNNDNNAAG
jgi:hypothetical protein